MNRLHRVAAAGAMTALTTLAVAGHASAHANAVTCVDQTTSTWRVTNDYPLTESFTSLEGPSGNVAAGNGQFTDVVYVGDSLQIDAVWTDGFTESRTGTGDCTPEQQETTTTTELVTTTTEQETTTSTTTTVTTAPTSTTVPGSTTSTEPSTTLPTTSSLPSTTSSSVATTSTTSPPLSSTTSIPETSTTPPAPSSSTPPSSLPPECSDNPNTPQNDCAPVCQPVTQPDGTNSCATLPPTGFIGGTLLIIAGFFVAIGLLIGLVLRRRG